jgi:hypothetical protein
MALLNFERFGGGEFVLIVRGNIFEKKNLSEVSSLRKSGFLYRKITLNLQKMPKIFSPFTAGAQEK